jgi:hypothetical protein
MTITTLNTLLNKLSQKVLSEIASGGGKDLDKENKTKTVKAIVDHCYQRGVEKFVSSVLNVDIMKTALQEAGETVSNNSRDAVLKQFNDSIGTGEGGLEVFLTKLNQPTLEEFVKLLDFETDATTKDQFSYDIADEVLLLGTRVLIEKASAATLKDALKTIGKKVSGKKAELEDRLLNEAFPGIIEENEEKDSETPKKSKSATPKQSPALKNAEIIQNRKPLEKGITYDEVFQGYWADELKDFCRKNGLRATSNKKDLIKRILNWFENPEEKGFPEKKRKKKQKGTPNKKQKLDNEEKEDKEEKEEEKEEEK